MNNSLHRNFLVKVDETYSDYSIIFPRKILVIVY